MDKQTLREFDALCLPKVEMYDAGRVQAIGKKTQVSQTVFAAYLNTTHQQLDNRSKALKSLVVLH